MNPRILLPVLALALSTAPGCAQIAAQHEDVLAQSGFEKKLAESPQQQGELARLPSRKLVRVARGNGVAYVYADPDSCRCLYVGDERDYESAISALARELAYNDSLGNPNPIPSPTPEELARYEVLARDSILDPTDEPTVDWSLWE